jgi:alpha-beta hydrolase superfamily lysophospholipase
MKPLLSAILTLAVAYAALLLLLALSQTRLLYLPMRAGVAQLQTASLRAWPSPEAFRGLVAEPRGAARATAIVFHGNAGHAGHRDFYAAALVPLGLRVILAEYPGYGPRDGELGEASFVADARQTIAMAREMHGGPLLLVGESLGAGVVAAATSGMPGSADGLLLITPWDRLANVGAYHYPWVPVRWLLRERYDNLLHLRAHAAPVVVAVAERDTIVPARFGRALHDAIGGPKHLLVIAAAEHNDWPYRVDTEWWRAAVDLALGARR